MNEVNVLPEDRVDVLVEAIDDFRLPTANQRPANDTSVGQELSPRWEDRDDDEMEMSPEEFVRKYYPVEKAAVTPRPIWDKDGPYGNRPAEFIAIAYLPEMKAGTLHRALVGHDNPDLPAKLASWLRSHPMPAGIDIPTKPEWYTRQAENLKERGKLLRPKRPITPQLRLYDAMRKRAKPV